MRTVISHPSQPAPLNLMLLAQNDHKNMFCSNQVKKPQQLKIWDWLFASPWDKFPPPLFFIRHHKPAGQQGKSWKQHEGQWQCCRGYFVSKYLLQPTLSQTQLSQINAAWKETKVLTFITVKARVSYFHHCQLEQGLIKSCRRLQSHIPSTW